MRKKWRTRFLRLGGHVDLALPEALQEVVGRQVDQLDLVGLLEDRIGDRLAHDHPGDLGHDVVEALQMLDVQRGVDVDAGLEQLLDVLPALGVTAAGGIGVGQLVHEDEGRTAGEGGVQVELPQRGPAVLDERRGQELEPLQQGVGFGPTVGLDVPDDHVDAFGMSLARGLEHGVGLPDSRRRAEEELQLAPGLPRLLLLDPGEQGVRIGPPPRHAPSVGPGAPERSALWQPMSGEMAGGETAPTRASEPWSPGLPTAPVQGSP